MIRRLCLLTIALTFASTIPTVADDLNPPDYRSSPRSTRATWDFVSETGHQNIPPDSNVLPGDAAAPLQAKFPNFVGYPAAATFGNVTYTSDLGGGYVGVADGGGGLVFIIPNWMESTEDESTRLRLQVTFTGPEPPTAIAAYGSIPGEFDTVNSIRLARVPVLDASQPPGSGYFYEDWELIKSPMWEQVVVFVPEETVLLQVIIDTGISHLSIFDHQFEGAGLPPWK